MAEPSDPTPQRIGDAERDQAAEYLREHLAQGRLDADEFDDRLNQALTARTSTDIEPLFKDLPAPKPGQSLEPAAPFTAPPWQGQPASPTGIAPQPASVPAVRKPITAWAIASAAAWPAAVIVCFATGWQYWWIMLIPLFFPWWLNRGEPPNGNRHRTRHRP